jgi:hypothetical protein
MFIENHYFIHVKKNLLILVVGLLCQTAFAQSTSSGPHLMLRPFVENGIDFIRNEGLKLNYETQSKYFWGFGFQIGHPEISSLIPFAQASFSNYKMQDSISLGVTSDSALRTNQYLFGVIIPLKKTKNLLYRARIGYSYARIRESFYDIDRASHGFQIGMGIERRVFKHSRVFCELSYNYQKLVLSYYRDFDMIKLSFGFVL